MKHARRILLGSLFVMVVQIVATGCVGYVGDGGGGGVVYGPSVWVHDDVWIDGGGRGWYGDHNDHAYVHPDRGGGRRR
jgi:hypothetical protein